MKTGNIYKISIFLVIFFIAIGSLIHRNNMHVNRNYHAFYNRSVDFLEKKLSVEKPIPVMFSKQDSKTATYIYVLGGNQESLISRFRIASSLYHQGLSKKILILSRPGITEFNQELGRNLTNDEWSIRELEKLNVRKEDIEPAFVKKGIFGTLSEAKDLSDIVRKKGCRRLILVTSNYHTRRVFSTFSKFASNNSFEIFIYGSNDTTGLGDLLFEYLKLLIYNNFAIPSYTESAL